MKTYCMTIQMKATGIEQYFHVVLFIMLYKVVLTFKSVDENLVDDDHSNESYWAAGRLILLNSWEWKGNLWAFLSFGIYTH